MATPSLAMTPSGYKAAKLYSIIPADGSGDFTVSRNDANGSRINSDGVVEFVAANVPRIDYTESGCPVLLIEPASTNLYLNSDVMVTQNLTVTNTAYTVSFYGTGTITFTGTHTGSLIGTGATVRVSLTFTPSAGTLTSTVSATVTNAQAENLGYATSFILTIGSSVSRLKDKITGAGDSSTFNSLEGVLFVEIAALLDDGTDRIIQMNDGTTANTITLSFGSNSNQVRAVLRVGGANQMIMFFTVSDTTQFNKIAFKWSDGDYALWIDAVEVATSTGGSIFGANTLNGLGFSDSNGNFIMKSKVRQLKIFETALTDVELTTLTT